VVAVFTLHPGKAVLQVAAIEITVNNLLEIGMEESVGPLKPFLVALDEGFQMILDTTESVACGLRSLYTGAGAAMIPHLRGKQAVYIRTLVLFVKVNI